MRWFAVIFRNSGLNWSPAPILTGITLYSRPSSSSAICTLWPFGVGQEYSSSITTLHVGELDRTCHSGRTHAIGESVFWSHCLTMTAVSLIYQNVVRRSG